jgi:hypothetical protein
VVEQHKKSVAEIALTRGERAARKSVLQDLFYDFNRSRGQIYWLSFWRGVFFGFGTIIGGTVVVGLVIWALSGFEHSIPLLQQIVSSLKHK